MKKLYSLGLISLCAVVLVACGSGEEKKESTSSSSSTTQSSSAASNSTEFKFENNQVEINDLKIVITDYKVLQVGEVGNEYGTAPVIAFWYDTTNKTEDELNPTSAWMAVFEAVQDNDPNAVNTLSVASLPDQQFLDSQLQTIKKDGTVSNAIAYELTDTETPVTLKASQGLMGPEIGSQDFPLN